MTSSLALLPYEVDVTASDAIIPSLQVQMPLRSNNGKRRRENSYEAPTEQQASCFTILSRPIGESEPTFEPCMYKYPADDGEQHPKKRKSRVSHRKANRACFICRLRHRPVRIPYLYSLQPRSLTLVLVHSIRRWPLRRMSRSTLKVIGKAISTHRRHVR
jgi:hypothetical protein